MIADELLRPSKAAAYLGEKWGRPFTAKDFLNLRTNRDINIDPDLDLDQSTLWKRSTLDLIAATVSPPALHPEARKPRRKRKSSDA
jgi:hypothetical protein